VDAAQGLSNLPKLTVRQAGEAAERAALSDAARALLEPQASPQTYLAALTRAGLHADAVRFLAQALPPREAVWWACVCTRTTRSPDRSDHPDNGAAQQAAESWVYEPTEKNRRLAMDCASRTDFQSPSAWSAVAAFWSGGSLAPPDLPDVPPAPHLCGTAVAGAVILAAVRQDPERAPERFDRFLRQGLNIAAGGNGKLAE